MTISTIGNNCMSDFLAQVSRIFWDVHYRITCARTLDLLYAQIQLACFLGDCISYIIISTLYCGSADETDGNVDVIVRTTNPIDDKAPAKHIVAPAKLVAT
jgi:hypothetical protein